MKKCFLTGLALIMLLPASLNAQKVNVDFPEYQFTTVVANPITPVKDQASSGTCWAFSTIGFIESEIIRICKIKDTLKYPDLSEFFIVSHSYKDRAEKYVRLDGKLGFSAGSGSGDVFDVIKQYGIVPQSEMTGMNYGTELPRQAELDAVLKAYVDAIVRVPNKSLTTAWKNGFQGVLDAYLGKCPQTFNVNGVEYTPESYRDALKINPDDYVSLTSFTHHPFYTSFILEVPDNWRWDVSYNIPIDELMNIIDKAVNDGYTIAWATDVSCTGFTRDGKAFVVDEAKLPATGSDQAHWTGEGEAPGKVSPEEVVSNQERRQDEFDRKIMTDDHGMQIYGISKDQFGAKYYMVKNSWGSRPPYNGIWYATENFVKSQTLSIMVHKSCLSAELKSKLGIK